MVNITLSPEDAEFIADALHQYHDSLLLELSKADSLRFKEGLREREAVHGVVLSAQRHDIGNPIDWLKTNLVFALRDAKTWSQIAPLLRDLLSRGTSEKIFLRD